MDESTDICDTAQLAVFVRFIMPDFSLNEELLGMVGLKGTTTGREIKSALVELLKSNNVSSSKLSAITTDGAPAMCGKNCGAVALLRQEENFPNFIAYHCLIHQESLCAKQINLTGVMSIVVDIVCFIRAKALNHRQFKNLLEELESSNTDVFLHTEVRWLSRSQVLLRFCDLLPEIRMFLASKSKIYEELSNPAWLLNLAFLTDISKQLNLLNEQLQGQDKTVPVMYQCIEAFQRKLSLFSAHMSTSNFTHFPTLGKMTAEVDKSKTVCTEQEFCRNLDVLAEQFETRFSECRQRKSIFQFTIDPFSFEPDKLIDFVPATNIASAQLALLELQSDLYLSTSADVNRRDCLSMWKTISSFSSYSTLCDVAKRVLSMFGSTYRCESAFSAMKAIKSKERSRITDEHLMHCVRAATTKYVPSFAGLVHEKQCQGSH